MADQPHPSGLAATGIDAIDETFGGGLPRGSLLALVAPPDSPGEYITHALATVPNRVTEYVTTARSVERLEADLHRYDPVSPGGTGSARNTVPTDDPARISITRIDAHSMTEADTTPLDAIESSLDALREGVVATAGTTDESPQPIPLLVVDAMSTVMAATERTEWQPLLDRVETTITELGGIACFVLHGRGDEYSKPERQILHTVDCVFHYEMSEGSTDDTLRISKFRRPADEATNLPVVIPLVVGDSIARNPDERA